ncbi:MAG: PH domain-containing protein [Deltaproteobacteria bacterium]|jgi:hypothetical protein|nr:PH domain-containing protein [Deltaproteobacteria bacterium]
MSPYDNDIPDHLLENSFLGRLRTFGIKRELRFLAEMLPDRENVLALTRGSVDHRWWIMALTDSRVVLLNKGLAFGHRQLEVPLAKIKSVSYKTGLAFGTIFIDTGAGTIVLESVNRKCAAQVSAIICEALASGPGAAGHQDKAGDVIDQLERLAALRDRGALTETEFLAQKNGLLALSHGQRYLPPRDRPPRPEPRAETPPRARPPETRPEPRALPEDDPAPARKPPRPLSPNQEPPRGKPAHRSDSQRAKA